jgi:hypothetical protein
VLAVQPHQGERDAEGDGEGQRENQRDARCSDTALGEGERIGEQDEQ